MEQGPHPDFPWWGQPHPLIHSTNQHTPSQATVTDPGGHVTQPVQAGAPLVLLCGQLGYKPAFPPAGWGRGCPQSPAQLLHTFPATRVPGLNPKLTLQRQRNRALDDTKLPPSWKPPCLSTLRAADPTDPFYRLSPSELGCLLQQGKAPRAEHTASLGPKGPASRPPVLCGSSEVLPRGTPSLGQPAPDTQPVLEVPTTKQGSK